MKLYNSDRVFIVVSFFFLLFFHVAVDINSVEDLPTYKDMFTSSYKESFSSNFSSMWSKEYLFVIYNFSISLLSHDYVIYLIIYNLILIGLHYWLSLKYSPSVPVSIVLFILFTYSESLFVIRQYLALSLLLLTVPLIINRKVVPYIILCTIAFFIHNSSIMWFPIYFFYRIKNKKMFVISLASMTVLFALLNTDIGRYIMMFGFSYDTYLLEGQVGQASIFAKLIPLVYLISYVFLLKEKVLDEGINKLCLISLVLLVIGYVFTPSISLVGRIMHYYQSLLIIAIPIMMKYIRLKPLKILFLSAILCLQGYSSMKPLKEDYFSSYRLNPVNLELLCILIAFTVLAMLILKRFNNEGNNYITKL